MNGVRRGLEWKRPWLAIQLLALVGVGGAVSVWPAQAHTPHHGKRVDLHAGLRASEQGTRVAPSTFVALVDAAKLGTSVIIADQTSKTTTVLANPDGTLTSLVAAGPVQEPDSSSPTGYSPIDTTLEQGMGGYTPTRVDTPVSFSDGTDSTLASMSLPGKAGLQMQWSGNLPVPDVSGSTLTYHDVQPGVDIQERALATGFDFRIVLTQRPAGPISFSVPLQLSGITAAVTKDGRFVLTDPATGKIVAASDPSVMWGANGGDTPEPADQQGVTESVTGGDEPSLTITPSTDFLQDPTLVYPVVIDPSTSLSATVDTYVDQLNPTTTYNTNTLLKAGWS